MELVAPIYSVHKSIRGGGKRGGMLVVPDRNR